MNPIKYIDGLFDIEDRQIEVYRSRLTNETLYGLWCDITKIKDKTKVIELLDFCNQNNIHLVMKNCEIDLEFSHKTMWV